MRLIQNVLVCGSLIVGSVSFAADQSESLGAIGSSVAVQIPIKLTAVGCLDVAKADTEKGLELLGPWKSALCKYFEAERVPTGTEQRSKRRQLWRESTDELNRAQTRGLTGNEHAFSALIEGLTYCRQAQDVLAEIPGGFAPGKASAAQSSLFCSSRRQALASFSDVEWPLLNIKYLDTTLSVDKHFDAMGMCYSGVLSSTYDNVCGLVSTLANDTIDVLVDQETEAALYQAFDSAGAPVDKLIFNKLSRIRAVVQDAWKEMTGCENPDNQTCLTTPLPGSLEASARTLKAQHTSLKDATLIVEPKVNALVQSYRNSILSGFAVLDEYNRWKDGLYEGNLKVQLDQKLAGLTQTTGDFRRKQVGTNRSIAEESLGLSQALVKQSKYEQTRNKSIKALCQVVFCEFYEWNRLDEDTVPVCTELDMADNPLCVDQNYKALRGGTLRVEFNGPQTKPVIDFCVEAGFPASFAKIGAADPQACFANFASPE